MDPGALQDVLEQAIANASWVTLHLHGCAAFSVLPTAIENRVGAIAVECTMTGRYDPDPPRYEETHSGEAMRNRLQSLGKRKGSLLIDPGMVVAAFTHQS
jgi:hypothetical protein